MKRLGLDISTACTGWAVASVDVTGAVIDIELGHIDLTKINGLIPKALHAERVIRALQEVHKFDEVYVEENMQAFHPGASSAQTIVKLAKFNGIVTFLCHQATGKMARSVNVNRARKAMGISLQREKICGISTKEQVFKWASAHPLLQSYQWPYKTLGSGPRKGTTILEQHAYDMADAFVVVMSGPVVPEED